MDDYAAKAKVMVKVLDFVKSGGPGSAESPHPIGPYEPQPWQVGEVAQLWRNPPT